MDSTINFYWPPPIKRNNTSQSESVLGALSSPFYDMRRENYDKFWHFYVLRAHEWNEPRGELKATSAHDFEAPLGFNSLINSFSRASLWSANRKNEKIDRKLNFIVCDIITEMREREVSTGERMKVMYERLLVSQGQWTHSDFIAIRMIYRL